MAHGGKQSTTYIDYKGHCFKRWIDRFGCSSGANIIRCITDLNDEAIFGHGRKVHVFFSVKNFMQETSKFYIKYLEYISSLIRRNNYDTPPHCFILHFPMKKNDEIKAFLEYLDNVTLVYQDYRNKSIIYGKNPWIKNKNLIKTEYGDESEFWMTGPHNSRMHSIVVCKTDDGGWDLCLRYDFALNYRMPYKEFSMFNDLEFMDKCDIFILKPNDNESNETLEDMVYRIMKNLISNKIGLPKTFEELKYLHLFDQRYDLILDTINNLSNAFEDIRSIVEHNN